MLLFMIIDLLSGKRGVFWVHFGAKSSRDSGRSFASTVFFCGSTMTTTPARWGDYWLKNVPEMLLGASYVGTKTWPKAGTWTIKYQAPTKLPPGWNEEPMLEFFLSYEKQVKGKNTSLLYCSDTQDEYWSKYGFIETSEFLLDHARFLLFVFRSNRQNKGGLLLAAALLWRLLGMFGPTETTSMLAWMMRYRLMLGSERTPVISNAVTAMLWVARRSLWLKHISHDAERFDIYDICVDHVWNCVNTSYCFISS